MPPHHTAEMDASHEAETGGPAAQKFYNSPELWRHLLLLLPKQTLAVLMRTESAVMTSVAEVLYKSVHQDLTNMWRKTPRQIIYCDAVRSLDLSPIARINSLNPRPRKGSEPSPSRFRPGHFLDSLAHWREKYPNLQKIYKRYPKEDKDDAYVAHLDGDKILIELESVVCFETFRLPFVAPTSDSFPPTPTHAEMQFHHTFGVKLIGLSDLDDLEELSAGPGELEKHWLKWKQWMFQNPTLDRRISYIEFEAGQMEDMEEVTLEEVMEFLSQRKADNCEPITRWTNSLGPRPFTAEEFRDFIVALGPELRVLYLDEGALSEIKDATLVISILDEVCPRLQYLEFWPQSATSDEMHGLNHLRKLTLHNTKQEVSKVGIDNFARHLARIGPDEIVYQNTAYGMSVLQMSKFNKAIHWYRQSPKEESDDESDDESEDESVRDESGSII